MSRPILKTLESEIRSCLQAKPVDPRVGELLREAKELCGHGHWVEWITRVTGKPIRSIQALQPKAQEPKEQELNLRTPDAQEPNVQTPKAQGETCHITVESVRAFAGAQSSSVRIRLISELLGNANEAEKQAVIQGYVESNNVNYLSITLTDHAAALLNQLLDARFNNFIAPTPEEVDAHLKAKGIESFTGEDFCDFYRAQGWTLSHGKKMSCWKSAVGRWTKQNADRNPVVGRWKREHTDRKPVATDRYVPELHDHLAGKPLR